MSLPPSDPLAKYTHRSGFVQLLRLTFPRADKDAVVDLLSNANWRLRGMWPVDDGLLCAEAERPVTIPN
jgi:hypothetical protein